MSPPETLADLAVFVAVVKAGSFTAAADALELSKSQVSKCVNRLEAALGARLLHRTTRRLRLTEAGTALYETSHNALQSIEDAQLAVSNLQGAPRGTLKVSASIAFGSVQLPQVVSRLMAQYPDLAVELLLEDRHVDLVREGIDVAVRITGDPPDSGLVYRRLGPNRQVVCASPAYLQRRGVPHAPQDLAGHDCIAHLQRTTPRTWHFTAPGGGKVSVQINGRVAISSALAVRRAALEGLGIIELNSYLVGPDIKAGRLVRLLAPYEPKQLSVYAVFPQRRYLAPKVRVFIDAMLERMAPEPVWDDFLLEARPPASLPERRRTGRTRPSTEEDAPSPPGYARKSRPGNRASRR
ncbi:MAG TPA: LysR family transcriptional regulator [Burkholderiales bacterium]|nr:LysR family transcriptional regulator [Burkholderiales bacterium]